MNQKLFYNSREEDVGRKSQQKRMLATATIIAVLLVSLAVPVAGEHYAWDCPECGRTGNTGNYCGMCAHPAPWISGEEQQNSSSNASDAPARIDMSSVKVGDVIKFGRYEQDNNTANGLEEIEWMVLDVQNGKALLLSKNGLEAKPYNEKYTSITWEQCTLRIWMNDDFLKMAFSGKERTAILTTEVKSMSQGYSKWRTNGGKNTQDQIFLLSYVEAKKYLHVTSDNNVNLKSRVSPTAYAKGQGAWTSDSNKTEDGSAAGWWWLRSSGSSQSTAASVNYDGSLNDYYVSSARAVVRPALWLNLESEIF